MIIWAFGVCPGNIPVYLGSNLKVIDRRAGVTEMVLRRNDASPISSEAEKRGILCLQATIEREHLRVRLELCTGDK
ncbi:hypothetical protein K7X08_036102 [Anisodus acutangulus]|uniref:Uncharacterized protein n=1 Tax=Anisodus acutangulus TaxID=402998 RepID=A0A9Q1L7N9_9SOLA|nr:hypothetical protein K7X08_036102 [Anisodus acutangulus]